MIGGALEGTTAIDVSGHVAGPYAGSLLGDLGCEVIKVELPGEGDTHRGRNPKYEGYGPSFRALNRNKKSVTLNLREPRGREILLALLETGDVLIENFRPATRRSLGLEYQELSKLNPKLIHCSISGYGQSGPYRDKPGFDTIGQALSGMMSLVTDLDDPKVAGVSFVDHTAGIFAAHGVMAALLARQKTGRGQFVDVSLLQVAVAFIESHVADYLNGGEAVSRENFPKGRIYSLLDSEGRPFMVHLSGHNKAWEGLLRGAKQPLPGLIMTGQMDHERPAFRVEQAVDAPLGKILARDRLAAVQIIRHVRFDERDGDLQQRNVDKLPAPGLLAGEERGHDPMGGEDTRGVIDEGDARDFGIVEVGNQAHHAGERLTDRVEAGLIAVRSALTVSGDRAMDQFRIEL